MLLLLLMMILMMMMTLMMFAIRPNLAKGRPGDQLKLGLTKTMINNVRQLSRRLVGI